MSLNYSWNSLPKGVRETLSDLSLLVLRIWLAQEFLYAAYRKLSGAGFTAPEWFADLVFPVPFSFLPSSLNWSLVSLVELICGLAILLGLFTRLSSLILLIVVVVAVYAVHFDLSWAGWNQIDTDEGLGFKVPLMMGVMLFTLLAKGAGRYALDYVWKKSL